MMNHTTFRSLWLNTTYVILGVLFGIVLFKSEVVSWFRILEMFRFESFHMYGVIGTAILTAMISLRILKSTKAKTFLGEPISIQPKQFHAGQIIGGLIFGMGWGMIGACPGPLFVLMGSGYTIIAVAFLSALAGTWMYGWLRERLPH